jgi:exodeoxyribonuclease V
MTTDTIKSLLLKYLEFEPTPAQVQVIERLSQFIQGNQSDALFVLKGYAGTGKTTLISALVKTLPHLRLRPVLLAPTGRAAKVFANYSGKQALTIHKKIYKLRKEEGDYQGFSRMPNLHSNTIFIVDEASMISDSSMESAAFGKHSLLEDLLAYVREGENCKIIFVGDGAQLPPVGSDISPALDENYLEKNFLLHITSSEMRDVVRQKQESGILNNATALRNLLSDEMPLTPRFNLKNFKDIEHITGADLEDAINSAYGKYSTEDVMIICRSNKRANIYNQQVRARILWREEQLSNGDLLMVVKNNYFWLPDESKAGFIANGDIVEVVRVKGRKEMYGFTFADVVIRLLDYPDEPELEVKILLDTIDSEAAALTSQQSKELYLKVQEDYLHIQGKQARYLKMRKDPYLNALQVKFAYAVTCHKAQGGQWPCVFVEQGYITDEMINKEFIRWLYTALTRATEKLYLVNFNKSFLE